MTFPAPLLVLLCGVVEDSTNEHCLVKRQRLLASIIQYLWHKLTVQRSYLISIIFQLSRDKLIYFQHKKPPPKWTAPRLFRPYRYPRPMPIPSKCSEVPTRTSLSAPKVPAWLKYLPAIHRLVGEAAAAAQIGRSAAGSTAAGPTATVSGTC